ncbi:MAG: tRNA pseudouridine(38-40) synthase TruA [Sphingobacteriales bacterium]|nr:tRNA pseudouridine(38-40) synthase TruA [Sphingobacteriales bacterium]
MNLALRYFIEISYKGSAYHGWQIQPNAISVQEVFNKALKVILKKDIETLGCGRTDTGVHASQFYLHLDLDEEITDREKMIRSLNAILPQDIAVKNILKVSKDAHARFDATLRSYEYHIHFKKNPFKTDSSWLLRNELDISVMNKAAKIILEYQDFGAFCKANADNFTNLCEVSRSEWEVKEDEIIYHISANRFLRNMVRAIVGTLVEVGNGKLKPEAMHQIIQSQNRSEAGVSVPACGLFLTAVHYPYIKN